MSSPLFPNDVLFLQRMLRAEGLYVDDLDGNWGPHTEAAVQAHEARADQLRESLGSFDVRTEGNLATLTLRAQQEARKFLRRVLDGGLTVRVLSGTRTYAQQNDLFKQGRFGNPGPVVTNARGGFSNHNFGIAWDIGVFTSVGGYIADGPQYEQAASTGLTDTLEWGGNWVSIVDKPHYQLKLGLGVSQLRAAFEAGQPIAGYALN